MGPCPPPRPRRRCDGSPLAYVQVGPTPEGPPAEAARGACYRDNSSSVAAGPIGSATPIRPAYLRPACPRRVRPFDWEPRKGGRFNLPRCRRRSRPPRSHRGRRPRPLRFHRLGGDGGPSSSGSPSSSSSSCSAWSSSSRPSADRPAGRTPSREYPPARQGRARRSHGRGGCRSLPVRPGRMATDRSTTSGEGSSPGAQGSGRRGGTMERPVNSGSSGPYRPDRSLDHHRGPVGGQGS
jgi:hypothetical protein